MYVGFPEAVVTVGSELSDVIPGNQPPEKRVSVTVELSLQLLPPLFLVGGVDNCKFNR